MGEHAEYVLSSLNMSTTQALSDVEVLKGSRSQPWMFGMLVDRYQEPFLRKGTYILRSHEAAEDAVQETFLKIYKYADRFVEQENASFQSWAYKILTNTCYSHLSRKIKDHDKVRAVDFADLDVSGQMDNGERLDQTSFVHSVLSRLSPKLARLLSLYFFEDKSYEEIAVSEDLSLSAVRSGLHRAKKQFKDLAMKIT